MSGHSKWHNIQKTKGAADAKRAQAFTKIAREMIASGAALKKLEEFKQLSNA